MAGTSLPETRIERLLDRAGVHGYHYGALLVMILTALVFQLAAPEADWARLVTIVIQGLTLLVALVVSRVHHWILRTATMAVCAAIVASAAALIGFGTLGPTAARLITALMVALAPISIARGVVLDFKEHGISFHTMFGVLCIYLLIGSLFAFAYGIISSIGSEPFFAQHGDVDTGQNFLYGATQAGAQDIWAVGSYDTGSLYQTLIERGNGTNWQIVPSPNGAFQHNYLLGVAAGSVSR